MATPSDIGKAKHEHSHHLKVRAMGIVKAGSNFFELNCRPPLPHAPNEMHWMKLARLNSLPADRPDRIGGLYYWEKTRREVLARREMKHLWGSEEKPDGLEVVALKAQLSRLATTINKKLSVQGFTLEREGDSYLLTLGPLTGLYFTSSHTAKILGFTTSSKVAVDNQYYYGLVNKKSTCVTQRGEPVDPNILAQEELSRVIEGVTPLDENDDDPITVDTLTLEREIRPMETFLVIGVEGRSEPQHLRSSDMTRDVTLRKLGEMLTERIVGDNRLFMNEKTSLLVAGRDAVDTFHVKLRAPNKESIKLRLQLEHSAYLGFPQVIEINLLDAKLVDGSQEVQVDGNKSEMAEGTRLILGKRAPLYLESPIMPDNLTIVKEDGACTQLPCLGEVSSTEVVNGGSFPVMDRNNIIPIRIIDRNSVPFSYFQDLKVEGTFVSAEPIRQP